MPWGYIRLNSGYAIPSIAFGTWTLGNGQDPIDQVAQSLENGFDHIDTAQSYRNEAEVAVLSRTDVFITTKYSGTDGLDMDTSIRNSVANSMSTCILIHAPRLAVPDIPTAWARMEKIREAGFARSIGVSNFDEKDLEILLGSAKIKPAVNQILLHPYVYRRQRPILEYAAKHGIVIEAYSALIPITQLPGGPLDAPLNTIASRLGATTDQVLLAWTKAKGAVVVTTSSKKSRLHGYLTAGDIALTQEDIDMIDAAGAIGEQRSMNTKMTVRKLVNHGLVALALLVVGSYYIDMRIF
ncbi:Aldo/keto reductase [Boletus edulis BED1]|uniref:Aldo/keto reductase n=1 Tax=Boletus edulis BED1 TaxID=1328754 RepID=A0AAD4BN45_BOLED|nr:Aldo/keto reductase [Boletus edulis BED1]